MIPLTQLLPGVPRDRASSRRTSCVPSVAPVFLENDRAMELDFRRPSSALAPAFKKFLDAFNSGDHDMWPEDSIFGLARTDMSAYLAFLAGASEGRGLPERWVPSDTYWVFAGDEMAGEVHVRHYVRGTLWRVGGHVGYSVQPKFRRQGIASAMLRHASATAYANWAKWTHSLRVGMKTLRRRVSSRNAAVQESPMPSTTAARRAVTSFPSFNERGTLCYCC